MQVMRIGTLRRTRGSDTESGTAGTARLDRRTKTLTKRLRPGDVAVIDHVDIDRVSADALVACQVAAVVNAAPSISGRYPNLGPEILVSAGIPLIDGVGQEVFARLKEGARVRVEGNQLLAEDGTVLAEGTRQDAGTVATAMADARTRVNQLLDRIPLLPPNLEHSNAQHEAIVDAILAGDAPAARQAMAEHIEGTASLLRAFLS